MSFYENGFLVVRNLISEEDALGLAKHLKSREKEGISDPQSPESLSFYSDDVLLNKQIEILPKIEQHTKLELFKTYNYSRIYKNGSILRIHKDRDACEISLTMDLGGDPWDIWVLDRNENPVKVKLNPGDALIYRGCEIWHWRGKFEGQEHSQVFMHYVDKYGPRSWAKDDIKRNP